MDLCVPKCIFNADLKDFYISCTSSFETFHMKQPICPYGTSPEHPDGQHAPDCLYWLDWKTVGRVNVYYKMFPRSPAFNGSHLVCIKHLVNIVLQTLAKHPNCWCKFQKLTLEVAILLPFPLDESLVLFFRREKVDRVLEGDSVGDFIVGKRQKAKKRKSLRSRLHNSPFMKSLVPFYWKHSASTYKSIRSLCAAIGASLSCWGGLHLQVMAVTVTRHSARSKLLPK